MPDAPVADDGALDRVPASDTDAVGGRRLCCDLLVGRHMVWCGVRSIGVME